MFSSKIMSKKLQVHNEFYSTDYCILVTVGMNGKRNQAARLYSVSNVGKVSNESNAGK